MYSRYLLLLPAVLAANIDVTVAPGGALAYSPDTVTAQPGDTLTFHWAFAGHSVSQSTFDEPCQYESGGVNSGIVQTTSGPNFVVTVKDTNPMWIFCSVPTHCQAGMVMAVNAPSSGNTYSAFKSAAANAISGTSPTAVTGGTFGSASSASSSSAASSMSASSMMSSSMSAASMSSSMSGASSMSSSSMGAAMSGTSTSASGAAQTGASTTASNPTSSPTKGAAVHFVGDAVAAVGAAALAVLL